VDENDTIRNRDWSRRSLTRRGAFGLLAGGMGAVAWHDMGLARKKRRARKPAARVGAEAKNGATHRPIADFVDAQGNTQIFVPPVADVRAWTSPFAETPLRFAWVDYVGGADDFLDGALNTGTSGKITETPQTDGGARVDVVLHTHRALAWAIELDLSCVPPPGDDFACTFAQIAESTPIFGYRPQEVDADHRPALVQVKYELSFLNTEPGAPLPDLIEAEVLGDKPPGYELLSENFHAYGLGPARDADSGDETGRAKLTVDQVQEGGVFSVEVVDVRRIGRRP
jgi:hypothetical protein